MLRAIGVSSLPMAGPALRVGASVTASTVSVKSCEFSAISPFAASVDVAVTDKLNTPDALAGGVIVSESNRSGSAAKSSAEIVQTPSPVCDPADSVAPSGTPEIVIDRLSEPSVSVSAAAISKAMAVSSLPPTFVTSSAAVSAMASRSMETVASNVAVSSLLSTFVTVTVRSKLTSEFGDVVIVRFAASSTVSVQVPSPLLVPADNTAPSGTPEIVTEITSEPSVSAVSAVKSRLMVPSSTPLTVTTSPSTMIASLKVTPNSSATAVIVSGKPNDAVAPSPVLGSVEVTLSCRLNAPLRCAGGVRTKLSVAISSPSKPSGIDATPATTGI